MRINCLSIDLLGRLQLWSVATQIIKLSSLPAVSSLNQVNMMGEWDIGREEGGGGGRVKSRTRLINMINTGIVEGVSVCPITIYLSSGNLEKNHNAFLKSNAKIYDILPTLTPPTPPHPTPPHFRRGIQGCCKGKS